MGCEGGDTGTRTGAGVGTAKTKERNTVAMERVLLSQDEVSACTYKSIMCNPGAAGELLLRFSIYN